MDVLDYFLQRTHEIGKREKVEKIVSSEDLLNLIKNSEVREIVDSVYEIGNEKVIDIQYIATLYNIVLKYSSKFETLRVICEEKYAILEFVKNNEKAIFFILENCANELGESLGRIEAMSIYDSMHLFYEERKLSQHINFIKSNHRDQKLLNAINASWSEYFIRNAAESKTKLFRILKDKDRGDYFLKSVNTLRYKEYGIAETFALTMLELDRLKASESYQLTITSLAISEARIEFTIATNKEYIIDGMGILNSSITVRNVDQGNTSLGFYSTINFQLEKEIGDKIYLYPNKQIEDIKFVKTLQHTITATKFVESHNIIGHLIGEVDRVYSDIHFLKNKHTPDELRAKIFERVGTQRGMFKDVENLSDLFRKDVDNEISNIKQLLKLCSRAEDLNMEYDTKFRLRYLISNVLLYGKDDLE